jgi:carbamoyl-phosphate synthase small subunit
MNDRSDIEAAEASSPSARTSSAWGEERPTALIVLADGTVIEGKGAGAAGVAVGEVCFNTAMTGYQEILTDPSYAGQIITFTFPHIGNVGANNEDMETASLAAASGVLGCVLKAEITQASNYRAGQSFDDWLKVRGIIAITGVDTRALTALIREKGMPNAVIAHAPDGKFDVEALKRKAAEFPGMVGLDLAKDVTCGQSYAWDETEWQWEKGYGRQTAPRYHVVAIDYGLKRNILRKLAGAGCKLTVLPATATAEEVLAHAPEGLFLSNGPGDPAATGEYAVPMIREVLEKTDIPVFGICLGHQMLALALGARTIKMNHGHHGANHPVKEVATGKVEITSMNHGFTVDSQTLPKGVVETHVSLFDGSNCGIATEDGRVFSVQHHPEASPGPQDSFYLFERFVASMKPA